jgi:hypothetical protein
MHHEVCLNTRIALGNFTQSNSANAKSSAALGDQAPSGRWTKTNPSPRSQTGLPSNVDRDPPLALQKS